MSDEVVKIDNSGLARLIKEELEKKGIKKMGLIGLRLMGLRLMCLMRFWNLKKKN